jgi:tetraprenyl-beta-curcumene synthase
MLAARDSGAFVWALVRYRRGILPVVRREQERWAARAAEIPDQSLRAAAGMAIREKGANAEATAVFAILAPRANRTRALRAMTALQTAVDYLDALGERAGEDPLADGLALHRALEEALSPGTATSDWYRLHPHREDGGFLAELVAACRDELVALPAWDAVAAAVARSARRCGQGQSQTHAAAADRGARLREWAEGLDAPSGYSWWEIAAGACSSVAAHAQIAAAADPRTGAGEAKLIEAAYFPPTGALTVLLDDLVDRERDHLEGEHNYIDYYRGPDAAADRLGLIARRAREAIAPLRRRRRHAAILAGIAGFYLASPRASGEYGSPIRRRLLESLGSGARLALAAVRLRRRS